MASEIYGGYGQFLEASLTKAGYDGVGTYLDMKKESTGWRQ